MSRTVPNCARELAAQLELLFAHDAELATQLNDAQQRLQHANPIGCGRAYTPRSPPFTASIPPQARSRTRTAARRVLDAPDPLRAAQQARMTIHHAFISYQNAAERRRQLAAEIGELAARGDRNARYGRMVRAGRPRGGRRRSRHRLGISAGT